MTPAPDQRLPTRAIVLAVALVSVVGLALMSLVNPYANIPLVSETMCSVRGNVWWEGNYANPPGCYDRDNFGP